MHSRREALLERGRPIGRALIDLLFPPRCALCFDPVGPRTDPFCAACTSLIRDARGATACPRCATTVAPFEVHQGRCHSCRRRRFYYAAVRRVGPYDAGLARLFRGYKYEGRQELRKMLAAWIADAAADAPWADGVEAVVPVPTHWRRRIRRDEYPADAFAEAVARRLDRPITRLLRRIRTGPRQVGLGYDERVRNVRGAFTVRKGVTLEGPRLLLVDDVKTTGATLNECARMLRHAGAAEVYAIVLLTAGLAPRTDV